MKPTIAEALAELRYYAGRLDANQPGGPNALDLAVMEQAARVFHRAGSVVRAYVNTAKRRALRTALQAVADQTPLYTVTHAGVTYDQFPTGVRTSVARAHGLSRLNWLPTTNAEEARQIVNRWQEYDANRRAA